MITFKSVGTVSYSHSITTSKAVSVAVSTQYKHVTDRHHMMV